MTSPLHPVTYRYDGTFEGFLSCVFAAFLYREEPLHFLVPGAEQFTLYPTREIVTSPEWAQRVYRSLGQRLSPRIRETVRKGFHTCLDQRETDLCRFIRLAYELGPSVLDRRFDPRISLLLEAVTHLEGEVHLLKGFVRFSQYPGLLAGEITPKNRVLPFLQPHFCARLREETFLLYDRTYKEALFHTPGRWVIGPVDRVDLGRPDEDELGYRQLWRRFYDTITIEARHNPKLRMTHMPKRYWENMTEFQADPAGPALPDPPCPSKQ